jgi:hypothetical protein
MDRVCFLCFLHKDCNLRLRAFCHIYPAKLQKKIAVSMWWMEIHPGNFNRNAGCFMYCEVIFFLPLNWPMTNDQSLTSNFGA